jgi:hypothetical protein
MRSIVKGLVLSFALTLGHGVVAHAEKPTAAKASKISWKRFEEHLREHQQYPATKAELIAACNNLMDFQDNEKKWFASAVPEGTYKSADDVIKALKAAR